MSTLMQASNQWRSRPDDERFLSLIDLNAAMQDSRARSRGKVLSSRAITAAPVADDATHTALVAVGPGGNPVQLTHWSFGQLAQRAGAPASYLRDLPAPLAADCINDGLRRRDVEDIGILLRASDGAADPMPTLAAVTGPNYGRIWNAQVTQALVNRFGDGVTGQWKVPGEYGRPVPVTKQNTTLYGSDRNMFVFLADESRLIDVPNRRDGQAGALSRGFFVWNSEVGDTTLGVATFLFDYVCANRIVWGASEYAEIRIRHTSGAPDRWLESVVPAIERYAASSADTITHAVAAARQARIDDVDAFLLKRFTRGQASAIKLAHLTEEARPIETLWDAATGITAYAKSITHQDARVTVEREAGRVLDMAA